MGAAAAAIGGATYGVIVAAGAGVAAAARAGAACAALIETLPCRFTRTFAAGTATAGSSGAAGAAAAAGAATDLAPGTTIGALSGSGVDDGAVIPSGRRVTAERLASAPQASGVSGSGWRAAAYAEIAGVGVGAAGSDGELIDGALDGAIRIEPCRVTFTSSLDVIFHHSIRQRFPLDPRDC